MPLRLLALPVMAALLWPMAQAYPQSPGLNAPRPIVLPPPETAAPLAPELVLEGDNIITVFINGDPACPFVGQRDKRYHDLGRHVPLLLDFFAPPLSSR